MTQVSYRFRCYPNKTQQAQLQRYFGSKRFVWNLCLAWRSNLYEALGESVTGVDLSRELTWLKRLEGYDWLREVPSTVLTQALRDQDRAFRNFFAGRASYPQFKARHHDQSIRFQIDQRRVTSYYRAGELLKLPGLGKLKVRWSRKPTGVPKMVTLSRDRAGRYFITLSVEEAIEPKPAAGQGGRDRPWRQGGPGVIRWHSHRQSAPPGAAPGTTGEAAKAPGATEERIEPAAAYRPPDCTAPCPDCRHAARLAAQDDLKAGGRKPSHRPRGPERGRDDRQREGRP